MTNFPMSSSTTSVPDNAKKTNGIGQQLVECLQEADRASRLTCGIFECAKLLMCNPDNVMLCVMPEVRSEDVTLHIQHTLIEAFCWENEIKMIKVDDAIGLAKLLSRDNSTEAATAKSVDTSCVLVENPKELLSPTEEEIVNFHETMIASDVYPKPVVQIPG